MDDISGESAKPDTGAPPMQDDHIIREDAERHRRAYMDLGPELRGHTRWEVSIRHMRVMILNRDEKGCSQGLKG